MKQLKDVIHYYLPYGLKIQIWDSEKVYLESNMLIKGTRNIPLNNSWMSAIRQGRAIQRDFNCYPFKINIYSYGAEKLIKPLLRPLSDLTKEIEHNGEKFVPIQELFQIAYESIYTHRYEGVYEKDSRLDEYLGLRCREESDITYHYGFTVELPNHFYMTVNGDTMTIPNFDMYEKLFEWNFDVFGLIESNQAIKK